MPAKPRRQLSKILVTLGVLAIALTGSATGAERLRIIPVPPHMAPQWTPMPDLPQMYHAPNLPTDVFRYRGRYYLHWEGAWYRSKDIKGPWWRVQRPPAILQSIQAAYFKSLPRGTSRSPGAAGPHSEGMMVTPEGKPAVPPPSPPSSPVAPVPPAPPTEAYAPSPPIPEPRESVTPSLPSEEDQEKRPPLSPLLPRAPEKEPPPHKEAQPPDSDSPLDELDDQEPAPLAVPKGDLPKAM